MSSRNASTRSMLTSFVLHGLWPQYAKGWPQDCRLEKRPWVPEGVIDDMREIMPSKGLVIHEYRTHGTCSGLDPQGYFAVARQLYDRIDIPQRFSDAASFQVLTPNEIEGEFLRANDWLDPSMVSVACRDGRLLDVRFCFNRDLTARACGSNEARRDCRMPAIGTGVPYARRHSARDRRLSARDRERPRWSRG